MILQAPASVVRFLREFVPPSKKLAPRSIYRGLRGIIVGLALAVGVRRSQVALGDEIYRRRRDRSTVSRWFNDRRFRSREILWEAVKHALRAMAPKVKAGDVVEWILALDGTALKRGANTKIKGAIRSDKASSRRKKRKHGATKKRKDSAKSSKKGRKTKYHTFLVGCIVTHTGRRIPLGRYTCDPKGFKRQGGPRKNRLTQIDLAKIMVKRALDLVPKGVHLVVVADSYFECEKLFALSNRPEGGLTFITPSDSGRCFADETTPSKSNGHRIRDYGLGLPRKIFSRLDLRRGSEDTACYRRYSKRQQGPKDRRTYWHFHEERTVAKLGTVGIVYSWKTPVHEPKRNFRKKSFKVLFCSDPTWSGKKVVEFYECRWSAIEILFRELKQHIGFADYTGQRLEALERHLDMVLLSFLYLEMERHSLLASPETAPKLKERAASARTQGMQEIIRWEVNRELYALIKQSYRSERKRRLLKAFFEYRGETADKNRRAAYA